jgi:hypothetical protein
VWLTIFFRDRCPAGRGCGAGVGGTGRTNARRAPANPACCNRKKRDQTGNSGRQDQSTGREREIQEMRSSSTHAAVQANRWARWR